MPRRGTSPGIRFHAGDSGEVVQGGFAAVWVLGTVSVGPYGDAAGCCEMVPVKRIVAEPAVLVPGLLHSLGGLPIGARA